MSKNLVLCCDGTANEFARDRTNVLKLYSVLEHDPNIQRTFYHPGLGTMEPAGALTPFARKITRLLGMAFGYGLRDDIRDTYVFLMRHYEPNDQVFLFGFSRGAYTVRAVSSLLHMYGLLRPGNESMVPYAIRMMMGIERVDSGAGQAAQDAKHEYFALAKQFKATMSRTCAPRFVGVWDTVSSVGWIANPLLLPYISNNPDIEIGRHAIALDERRAFFRTHLWQLPDGTTGPKGPRDLQQVWFSGVHSDVGGGYPESESGLSKLPLDWMLVEAVKAGLLVDARQQAEVLGLAGTTYARADPKALAHESLTGMWRLGEFAPKRHFDWQRKEWRHRMNLFRRRTVPAGSLIHESVAMRGEYYKALLPSDVTYVKTL